MKSLTIRGIDPQLERALRSLAEHEGISLNRAALRLMRRGAGLQEGNDRPRIGHALDAFIGSWSIEESAAFDATIARMFGTVDPDGSA